MSYQETIHGPVLLEYVNEPHDGHTYCLTKYGAVFRREDGSEEWRKFYDVMVHAVGAHVALIRQAPFQKVLVDNYTGPVPNEKGTYRTRTDKTLTDKDIQKLADEAEAGYDPAKIKETPRSKERRRRVAETKEQNPPKQKKEKAVAVVVVKPQRLGARAKKLLEIDFGLTRKQQDEVRAKADAISSERILPNGRKDGLTRAWDIYEADGREMPASLAAERDEFIKTGVLKRSGGGGSKQSAPKEERGGKNAASPAPSNGTSKQQQSTPEPSPGNGGPHKDKAEEPEVPASQTSEPSAEETETL